MMLSALALLAILASEAPLADGAHLESALWNDGQEVRSPYWDENIFPKLQHVGTRP